MKLDLEKLYELRHELHRNAELSNHERITSEIIKTHISKYHPDKIYNFDYGLAFVWDSGNPGKCVMFRADMDALPITEISELPYKSRNPKISHLCGHDGHMAILSGLAQKINKSLPHKGKVVLLFQPAEETGEGAYKITEDPLFKEIEPDMIFGLHNIPGYKKNLILLRKGSFACASRGMIIKLFGKSSHAGEPENGINPVFAIKKLINRFYKLVDKDIFDSFASLTIIFMKLGEIAFGTSPGYAEVMLTLRSETNEDMTKLIFNCEKIVKNVSKEENLRNEISYTEIFPATVNNNQCVNIVKKSAEKTDNEIEFLDNPFKWSEDFSYYTNKYKGAFFGLGSGTTQPALHNPDYDFPNEIIETGVEVFYNVYRSIFFRSKKKK